MARARNRAGRMWRFLMRGLLLVLLLALAAAGGVHLASNRLLPDPVLNALRDLPFTRRGNAADEAARWADALREGGYILFLRHAHREKWANVSAFDFQEVVTGVDPEGTAIEPAVCLSPQGIAEARLIGFLFAEAGVSVARAYASPSCRARQMAQLAFGRLDGVERALLHTTVLGQRQHGEYAQALRQFILELEVPAGQNIVLSGHRETLMNHRGRVIDRDLSDRLDRDETGFVILQRQGDEIVALYTFRNIREFMRAALELPLEQGPGN